MNINYLKTKIPIKLIYMANPQEKPNQKQPKSPIRYYLKISTKPTPKAREIEFTLLIFFGHERDNKSMSWFCRNRVGEHCLATTHSTTPVTGPPHHSYSLSLSLSQHHLSLNLTRSWSLSLSLSLSLTGSSLSRTLCVIEKTKGDEGEKMGVLHA
jgi:hypothetical protein